MRTIRRTPLRLSIGFAMLMLLVLASSMSAFADGTGTLTPTITGGSLSVVNNGSATIANTTLDGTDKSLAIAVPLTVTDATGSGAGWHMSIVGTQFHTVANATPYRVLPDTATTFTGLNATAICGTNSTCSLPTNNKSTGTTLPSTDVTSNGSTLTLGTAATPLSFYNAATNTGMGIINLQPDFSVSLPAGTTYAGTFSSDITITISTNP